MSFTGSLILIHIVSTMQLSISRDPMLELLNLSVSQLNNLNDFQKAAIMLPPVIVDSLW